MGELDIIRTKIGQCPTGGAVVTGAGKLPAKYVFHAVGPVYRDGRHGEPEQLASCYRTCLELAEKHEVAIITFPAISTGIYRYPLREAADIAIAAVAAHLQKPGGKVREAIFVLFGRAAYNTFAETLRTLSR